MAETLTLDRIPPGGKATVLSVSGDADMKKRIIEMGLTKGAIVEVERVAPLGDPMDLKIRGYRLSLRKVEASKVMVQEV